MSDVSIIVYHYVRELEGSRYPGIKGRRISEFRRQIEHIENNYNVVTVDQILAAAKGDQPLPPRAAWLTFDDGYADHYQTVYPMLRERGWQGSFFPPANTTLHREMLDVNKIHFILASEPDTARLVTSLKSLLADTARPDIKPFDDYWQRLSIEPDRFDTPSVVFVKRLLQRELPEDVRAQFTDALFQEHVGVDPRSFADDLYMSADNLREMIAGGMHIGSHGARHYWMNRLAPIEQAAEVDAALAFLGGIGAPTKDWVMCYPYGANNTSLHAVLADRGCALALTTATGIANLADHNPLTLPRIDTNELPY